jgi:hypothetical protein
MEVVLRRTSSGSRGLNPVDKRSYAELKKVKNEDNDTPFLGNYAVRYTIWAN